MEASSTCRSLERCVFPTSYFVKCVQLGESPKYYVLKNKSDFGILFTGNYGVGLCMVGICLTKLNAALSSPEDFVLFCTVFSYDDLALQQ